LKQVETKILIEELETDGHSPMKFICDDGNVYYTKYRSGKSFKKSEINCLVFEMVCTRLLKALNIPVPDEALVVINDDSIAPGQLKTNKRYISQGVIAWGSKEIPGTDLVKEIEQVQNKKEFNKLLNPCDLIRIAIFDLWVDNVDRHSGNYNLLLKLDTGKLEIITIDHAFTFGGLKGMNIFNEKTIPGVHKKLIGSRYFCSVINHINNKQRFEVANQFLSLIAQVDIQKIVDEVFTDIPLQWSVNETLKKRMIDFLQSGQRQKILKQICYQQLLKNFRRKKS
jgi:hypothetical protein